MQVAFALHELRTEGQYASLWKLLCTTDDVYTAVDKVCRLYEQPYYCNVDTRFRYAKEIEAELSKKSEEEPNVSGSSSERTSSGVNEHSTCLADANVTKLVRTYYPYRMIDKSMAGTDVAVVQAILTARGYYTGPLDGLFGDALDEAVRKFQSDHALDPDGVVGPLTWRKILSMED